MTRDLCLSRKSGLKRGRRYYRLALEPLEDRVLLAEVLFGGDVLKETFDDVRNLQVGSKSNGNITTLDDTGILASFDPATQQTTYQPTGIVFHHEFPSGGFNPLVSGGTTTPESAQQGTQPKYLLFDETDTITIQPYLPPGATSSDVSLVAIDATLGTGDTITFNGANGSETLTLPLSAGTGNFYHTAGPASTGPAVIHPGDPIFTSIGSLVLPSQPPKGWNTFVASEDDVIGQDAKGNPITLGSISSIQVYGGLTTGVDNVRALVFFPGIKNPPTANNDVYLLPAGAAAGQSFSSGTTAVTDTGGNGNGSVTLNDSTPNTDSSGNPLPLQAVLVSGPAHDPTFALNSDGTFTYTPDNTFKGSDSFTYEVSDGSGSGLSNLATVSIVTKNSPLDSDGDGVPDWIEALGPSNGVADADTIPDWQEQNVATLPAVDGQYWSLTSSTLPQSPGFIHVDNVTPQSQALPPLPSGIRMPAGLFGFQIPNLQQGQSALVSLTPSTLGMENIDGFYVLNPATNSWVNFPFDSSAQLGADVEAGKILLYLQDGQRGDSDGAADGVISFVGGPVTGDYVPVAADISFPFPHGATGQQTIPNNAAQLNPGPVTTILLDANDNPVAGPLVSSHGTVTIDSKTENFIYTPNRPDGLVQPDSFDFEVSNSVFVSNVAHVTLTVANNQAPVATDGTVTFTHQVGDFTAPLLNGDLSASDPDGDPLTFSLVPGSEQGGTSIVSADGSFQWITGIRAADPNTHELLPYQFQFRVTDPYGAIAVATQTIDIHDNPPEVFLTPLDYGFVMQDPALPVNEFSSLPPLTPYPSPGFGLFGVTGVVDPQGAVIVASDGSAINTNIQTPYSNAWNSLHVIVVRQPIRASIFNVLYDGNFIYKPLPGFFGTDSFDYVVSDGYEVSNMGTVKIHYPQKTHSGNNPFDSAQVSVGYPAAGNNQESWFLSGTDPNNPSMDASDINITSLQWTANPSPAGNYPLGMPHFDFPLGFIQFQANGGGIGTGTVPLYITLNLPTNTADPTTYWKYGPTPDNPSPHWYDFDWYDLGNNLTFVNTGTILPGAILPGQIDPRTGTKVPKNEIVLYFHDGQLGDDDLTQNSILNDAGGPGGFPVTAAVIGPLSSVRGQAQTFTLSAGDVSANAQAAGFTYTIDWGDGSPVQAIAATPGNGSGLPVHHAFVTAGPLTVTVTATDNQGLGSVPAIFDINVSSPAVLATGGFTVHAVRATDSGTRTVATFTDPAGASPLWTYSADILWGDRSTSAGTIQFNSTTGIFTVEGDHTYTAAGTYPITVTIHRYFGPDTTVTSSAVVGVPVSTSVAGASAGFVGLAVEEFELTIDTLLVWMAKLAGLPHANVDASIAQLDSAIDNDPLLSTSEGQVAVLLGQIAALDDVTGTQIEGIFPPLADEARLLSMITSLIVSNRNTVHPTGT